MADLVSISIRDFCAIQHANVSLRDYGMALITGENRDTDAAVNNGCGKSTIGKALTWCLFGETIDGDKHDKVIRKGASQAIVEVALDVDGLRWSVGRVRQPAKPLLFLETVNLKDDSAQSWSGSPAEIQAKIIELVGRDFRSFCNTTFFGQGDTERFYSAVDMAKKETLHRILRSDVFRKCEKQLRESDIKKIYDEIASLSGRETELVSKVGEYDLARIESEMQEWESGREVRIGEETDAMQRFLQAAKGHDADVKRRRAEIKAEMLGLEETLKKHNGVAEALKKLRGDGSELDNCITKLRTEVGKLSAAIDSKTQELETLKGKKCPTCTAPLDKGAPASHIAGLKTEVSATKQLYTECLNACRTAEQDRGDLRARIDKAMEAQQTVQAAASTLDRMKIGLTRSEADWEVAKAQYRERAREHLERAKSAEKEANPFAARLEEARARFGELQADLREVQSQLVAKRVEYAHYEFWVRGFGSRGLPSMLLDSIMPYLTERTNAYLRTLADGDITVEFSTQRELKSKKNEMRDEITVYTTIEGVEDTTPSHGQRRKMEIATDMALIDLAESREASSGLLFLDEVLDGLDSEGEARVLRLLRDLRTRYSSIFVVTHDAAMAEGFDKVLHVIKENKASTVIEVR